MLGSAGDFHKTHTVTVTRLAPKVIPCRVTASPRLAQVTECNDSCNFSMTVPEPYLIQPSSSGLFISPGPSLAGLGQANWVGSRRATWKKPGAKFRRCKHGTLGRQKQRDLR